MKLPGQLFCCEIDYDEHSGNCRDQLTMDFQACQLIQWQDHRLPTAFVVQVFPFVSLDGVKTIDEFTKLKAVVKKSKPLLRGEFDHLKMPAEDRIYWQNNMAMGKLQVLYDGFVESEKQIAEERGFVFERAMSFTGFMMHPDTKSDLQAEQMEIEEFDDADACNFQMEPQFRAQVSIPKKTLEDRRRERKNWVENKRRGTN